MVLWQKLNIFYLIHFKTWKGSLCEKKNAVCYFQISPFVPEIFKFLKYANWPAYDIIQSTQFWSSMMKNDISANLYYKYLILSSKILLNVLHNSSLTVLLPWQDTRFQSSPIFKGFFGHLWHSILMFANGASYAWSSKHINMFGRVCGYFQHFQAENHLHIEIKWVGTGKEWVAMETIFFIAKGVFRCRTISLPMVYAANWPR